MGILPKQCVERGETAIKNTPLTLTRTDVVVTRLPTTIIKEAALRPTTTDDGDDDADGDDNNRELSKTHLSFCRTLTSLKKTGFSLLEGLREMRNHIFQPPTASTTMESHQVFV